MSFRNTKTRMGSRKKAGHKDASAEECADTTTQQLQRMEAAVKRIEWRLNSIAGENGMLQRLEGRVKNLETSLQRAMDTFLQQMRDSSRRLEEPSPPVAPRASTCTLVRAVRPRRVGSAGAPAGGKESRDRQWVQHLVEGVMERRATARASPSSQGEALCLAAGAGKLRAVQQLLSSGADVNYTDVNGDTPLLCALHSNVNPNVVELLLENGADANVINIRGLSAMHLATRDSTGYCVKKLIVEGGDVDARDLDGATPLLYAVLASKDRAMWLLLTAFANVHLKVWSGIWKGWTSFDLMSRTQLLGQQMTGTFPSKT